MKQHSRSLVVLACLAITNTVAFAAPQIETPGFFIETIGLSVNELAAKESPYTPDGYFLGLQQAAAVAFAKNSDVVFVVEKAGRIRVIVDGVTQDLPVVDMVDQVNDYIDSGMGGIAIHPDFPTTKEILITYTHDNGITPIDGSKYARVARLAIREETDADGNISYFADPPTDDNVILGKLKESAEFPSCNDRPLGADCGAVDEAAHSFTFVHYGPDGKIYVGTGDGAGYFSPEPHALYAQINAHLSGKILRLNPDGSGPEDNPFFTGNQWDNESKVYAKGFRNPKSGSFDPATGKLCVGNVGWYLNEGIYCVNPGDNAGWPCRENGPAFNGYETVSLSREGERLASCPLDPSTYIEPDYAYAHQLKDFGGELLPIGAVIGCTRPTSDEYPESVKGQCVYGDYVFDTLEMVSFGENTVGNPSAIPLVSGAGNPTDLTTNRNGRICYSAFNTGVVDGRPVSEIRCIGYNDDGSVPLLPVPSFSSLADAADPASIAFNAAASYHPAGQELEYSWDFGDGTTAGDLLNISHTYQMPGDYQVTLTTKTVGTTIERSTFQSVNVPDPNFVTPIVPSVVDIVYSDNDHELSSPVEFTATVRNDLGTDSFRILANIYDDTGAEVGHLELEELFVVLPGQTIDIDFRWPQASELGNHTVGIEFYSEDYESWTLKYLNASTFFVRNRATAGSGVTPGNGIDENGNPIVDGVGTNPDSTPINGEEPGGPGVIGSGTDPDGNGTDGNGTEGGMDADGTDGGSLDTDDDNDDGKNLFGCSITSSNDPTLGFLLLGSVMVLFTRRRTKNSGV